MDFSYVASQLSFQFQVIVSIYKMFYGGFHSLVGLDLLFNIILILSLNIECERTFHPIVIILEGVLKVCVLCYAGE